MQEYVPGSKDFNLLGIYSACKLPHVLSCLDESLIKLIREKYDPIIGLLLYYQFQAYKKGTPVTSLGSLLTWVSSTEKNVTRKDMLSVLITRSEDVVYDTEDVSAEQWLMIWKRFILEVFNHLLKENDVNLSRLMKYITYVNNLSVFTAQVLDVEEENLPFLLQYRDYFQLTVPTGIQALDTALDGGLRVGELGLLQAPTSAGKTWMLVNLVSHALHLGYSVFVYEAEIGVYSYVVRILQRYYQRTKQDIENTFAEAYRNFCQFLREKNAELRIFHAQETTFDEFVYQFDEYSRIVQVKEKNPIRLIIIDYADKFIDTKAHSHITHKYDFLGSIYMRLKQFALSNNVAIWTASQLNRSAYKKDNVGLEATSESMKKVHNADIVINFFLKGNNLIEGTLLKSRRGKSDIPFILTADLHKGVIESSFGFNDEDIASQIEDSIL